MLWMHYFKIRRPDRKSFVKPFAQWSHSFSSNLAARGRVVFINMFFVFQIFGEEWSGRVYCRAVRVTANVSFFITVSEGGQNSTYMLFFFWRHWYLRPNVAKYFEVSRLEPLSIYHTWHQVEADYLLQRWYNSKGGNSEML